MAGIKDIAKKTGFSISTVSYALNGSSKVTEETRKKILAVAEELEYIPNGAARMLRARETKIIGAFLVDYSGSFYGQLLKGMREALNANGYELVICSGKQSRRLLLEKMVDGGIILDDGYSDEELLNYGNLGHKMIVLDREIKHPNIKSVLLDNETGAQLAIRKLLQNKTKKLYIIKGSEGAYDSEHRVIGALRELEQHPDIKVIQLQGHFDKVSGAALAEKILSQYEEPVSIFSLNDEMAVGIYDYIKNTDYKIGEHIHLIGFDNIELAHYVKPRLCTIGYSTLEWGTLATESLLKLLQGQQGDEEGIKVPVYLVEGESC